MSDPQRHRADGPLTRLERVHRHYRLLPRMHRGLITSLSLLILVTLLLPSGASLAARHTTPLPLDTRMPLTVALATAPEVADEPELRWQPLAVKAGDSLAKLFSRAGLSPRLVHDIDKLPQSGPVLRKLQPGDNLELGFNGQDLARVRYEMDPRQTLVIAIDDGALTEHLETKAVEQRESFAGATIKNNFWNAAVDAGLSANQIMRLAGLFGWDVDFALDIREGDHFTVLFEQEYLDGQWVGDGDILAAEFTNQGRTYRAVRHSDGNYYDDQGRAMKKAFLRAPVQFNYVSSNFNPRRLHPVTGQIKAHRGTDYVAPRGTPIMAAGDGTVVSSGYNKYNGNYVFIKHSNTYVTKYLHLAKRKVKKGQRVKQGQTIGTLGSTGRVTGAHLHYEFLVNGVHRNPRTVKLPESGPVAKAERAEFEQIKNERLAQLAHRQQLLLANL